MCFSNSRLLGEDFAGTCKYIHLYLPPPFPFVDSAAVRFYAVILLMLIGPRREKTCLRGFANNTVADQPAHPRSLISAFVIRFLESIICKLATGEISIC